jgi:hypothetical protein
MIAPSLPSTTTAPRTRFDTTGEGRSCQNIVRVLVLGTFRTVPSYETQLQMATREARRHLVAVEGNYPIALQRLQEACNYRMVR